MQYKSIVTCFIYNKKLAEVGVRQSSTPKNPEAIEPAQFIWNLEESTHLDARWKAFPLSANIPLASYFVASAIRAVGVSRDMGGISSSSSPATNMGVGATLPHRNNSQRARMNLVSGRSERSRISLVVPR